MIIPKLIVFDFDGVFTDNRVYVLEDGREMVCCSREDSLGIARLKKHQIPMMILSTEINPVVAARAKKLFLLLHQGCADKAAFLKKYLSEMDIPKNSVIFVGNDVNDLEAMRLAGFSACPVDAHPEIKNMASLTLTKRGGNGAIRELCDLIAREIEKPRLTTI
ncbi:MAG: HAD hydrolase family protein [Deltaproteobacteria bacterium]|jgi:N-acylneuraminate cytidylyltransferase|nr:HAD hydrolase family protein [Deltaproteobacteria bacterium]